MAKGSGKAVASPKNKATLTTSKPRKDQESNEQRTSGAPLDLQQKCLDIFRDALQPSADDRAILQEVKGHLYRRDFAAAFGKEEYLRVYASRWSPSRALGYLQIFHDLAPQLEVHPVIEDDTLSIVCIGGGAGGEFVGIAAWHSLRDVQTTLTAKRLRVSLVDMAAWSGVLESIMHGVTTAPELSKYASQAKKDANKALVEPGMLTMSFEQVNVLDEKSGELRANLSTAKVVTFLFTLNELYSTSMAQTQKLLNQLTNTMAPGSYLLVVDSPGSYSTVSINGSEKRYPMHWLLDYACLGGAETSKGGSKPPTWTKILSDESRWFRLDDRLQYLNELENMRYQIHLYRKRGPSDAGG